MRPLLRAPVSVRARLILWNVGILALVLLALGTISHYVLQRNLVDALDRQMSGRAVRMARGLEEMAGSLQRGIGSRDRDHRDRPPEPPPFPPPAPTGGGARRENALAAFFRPKVLTLQRRDWRRKTPDPPWDDNGFDLAAKGQTVRATISVEGEPARVLSLPFRQEGRIAGVIQMARPLSDVEDALRASSRTLLTLMPLALLLAGFLGAFLTDRALLPVRLLRDSADRIQAENLSQRLPVPGRDEFSDLARTFNQMLDRLERAFRQQARFTADASHELRTPLTVLRGNLSLALARPRSPEEYRDTLERASRVSERMSGLVEDLLLLARADAAQLVTDPEPVPLAEVVAAAVETLPGRPVEVTGPPEEGEPLTVRGNQRLLVTLFTNLLSNAARHTPPEGSIAIRVARQDHSATVTVEDTGAGIPPEHLPNIRERFYRVDDARSSESGGTGLGLAICESIAAAHGGSLQIRSEVGKGTAITVTLPLE